MKTFHNLKIQGKYAITTENLAIKFKDREIFKDDNFQLISNSKTSLIGLNGSGKTTLIKYILKENKNIKIKNQAKIGYFSQEKCIR